MDLKETTENTPNKMVSNGQFGKTKFQPCCSTPNVSNTSKLDFSMCDSISTVFEDGSISYNEFSNSNNITVIENNINDVPCDTTIKSLPLNYSEVVPLKGNSVLFDYSSIKKSIDGCIAILNSDEEKELVIPDGDNNLNQNDFNDNHSGFHKGVDIKSEIANDRDGSVVSDNIYSIVESSVLDEIESNSSEIPINSILDEGSDIDTNDIVPTDYLPVPVKEEHELLESIVFGGAQSEKNRSEVNNFVKSMSYLHFEQENCKNSNGENATKTIQKLHSDSELVSEDCNKLDMVISQKVTNSVIINCNLTICQNEDANICVSLTNSNMSAVDEESSNVSCLISNDGTNLSEIDNKNVTIKEEKSEIIDRTILQDESETISNTPCDLLTCGKINNVNESLSETLKANNSCELTLNEDVMDQMNIAPKEDSDQAVSVYKRNLANKLYNTVMNNNFIDDESTCHSDSINERSCYSLKDINNESYRRKIAESLFNYVITFDFESENVEEKDKSRNSVKSEINNNMECMLHLENDTCLKQDAVMFEINSNKVEVGLIDENNKCDISEKVDGLEKADNKEDTSSDDMSFKNSVNSKSYSPIKVVDVSEKNVEFGNNVLKATNKVRVQNKTDKPTVCNIRTGEISCSVNLGERIKVVNNSVSVKSLSEPVNTISPCSSSSAEQISDCAIQSERKSNSTVSKDSKASCQRPVIKYEDDNNDLVTGCSQDKSSVTKKKNLNVSFKTENTSVIGDDDLYYSKKDEISICFDARDDSLISTLDTTVIHRGADEISDLKDIKRKQKVENEIVPPPSKKQRLDVLPQPPCRPLEVFVSNNIHENADNNNPQWETYRKLSNDQLRYESVRKKWLNPKVPNVHTNLSTYNWRAKNGLPPLDLPCNLVRNMDIKNAMSGSVHDVFNKARDDAKSIFQQKVFVMEVRKNQRYNNADQKLNNALSKVSHSWRHYFYNDYRQELDSIQMEYNAQFNNLLVCLEERLRILDSAEEEMTTVCNFYQGLDGNKGMPRTHLTPWQLCCWYDREDILNKYEIHYSDINF